MTFTRPFALFLCHFQILQGEILIVCKTVRDLLVLG